MKKTIAIYAVATGQYIKFVPALVKSIEKYFLPGHNRKIFVFTDYGHSIHEYIEKHEPDVELMMHECSMTSLPAPHLPWPLSTMLRYLYYHRHLQRFQKEFTEDIDYFYHTDADVLFVSEITPEEVLGKSIGVKHCGFAMGQTPTYEFNKVSACYVDTEKAKNYYGGSFCGGETIHFIELCRAVNARINTDLKKGIIPLWHDESALNAHFELHPPQITLPPTFHFPEGNKNLLDAWESEAIIEKNAQPKIIVLEKGDGKEELRI